jgi:protein-S-isoprenylcysteine O-methyltransferase Ste14
MKPGQFGVTAFFASAASYGSVEMIREAGAAFDRPSWHAWGLTIHAVLQVASLALFAFFTIGRSEPIRRVRRPAVFAACALALGSFGLLREPPESVSTAGVLVGDAIVILFGAWLVVAVTRLGRCFGILPDARGLRTSGPYAIVRHPVYLGEIGVCAGLVIAAPSLWNLLAGTGFVVGQAVRMRLEELALTEAFPEYAEYAATTPRLIPFINSRFITARIPSQTTDNA